MQASRGIVICGRGLGVAYTANRFPRVRAAVVHDVETAALSRQHNDANVLALSGDRTDPGDAPGRSCRPGSRTPFEGGRHSCASTKIDALTREAARELGAGRADDPAIAAILRARRAARPTASS